MLRFSYANFFEAEYQQAVEEFAAEAVRSNAANVARYEQAKVEAAESYAATTFWFGLVPLPIMIFLLALGVQRGSRH